MTGLRYRIDPGTLEHAAARTLALNEVGGCNLALAEAVAFDPYREVRETGGFILIDRFTNGHRRGRHDRLRSAPRRQPLPAELRGRQGAARAPEEPAAVRPVVHRPARLRQVDDRERVERKLAALGRHSYLLDGDNVRLGLNRGLGFTDADRVENIRRVAEVAKLFVDAGLIVLVSFISPFRDERRMARALVEEGEFVEIFVDTPLEECERRDPKGLYRKARSGEIRNFTGIDSAYEPPEDPELVLNTVEHSVDEVSDEVIAWLRDGGYL